MRRSLAIAFGESSMAMVLQAHLVPPMPVHRADGGFGNQSIRGSLRGFRSELDQMRTVRHALHTVLDEFDRLVIFEPEESSRPHEVALAQAMACHLFVVAFETEHGPFHDELVRAGRHD